jgi:hypothetical protein
MIISECRRSSSALKSVDVRSARRGWQSIDEMMRTRQMRRIARHSCCRLCGVVVVVGEGKARKWG